MKNILITRQPSQAVHFINLLSQKGYHPFLMPMIETVPIQHNIAATHFDYVVFSSENSVKYFVEYFNTYTFKHIIAIGDKTADYLKQFDIIADIIPPTFSAEGLIETLKSQSISSKSFFIPGPKKRSDKLSRFLKQQEAVVSSPNIYETKPVLYSAGEIEFFLTKHMIDIITFASPSSAESFFSQATVIPDAIQYVSIGKTTYEFLNDRRIPSLYPENYTVEGMTNLIADTFK